MQSTGHTSTHELSLVPMHGSAMTYVIRSLLRRALSLLNCRGELFDRLFVFEPDGRRARFSLAGIDGQHHTTQGGRFDLDDRAALALHLDLSHGHLAVSTRSRWLARVRVGTRLADDTTARRSSRLPQQTSDHRNLLSHGCGSPHRRSVRSRCGRDAEARTQLTPTVALRDFRKQGGARVRRIQSTPGLVAMPPFSPGDRLVVLGAGATRGADFGPDFQRMCEPPLNADFFTQLQRISEPERRRDLVRSVITDVVELFGANFSLTMEDYFTQLEFLWRTVARSPVGAGMTTADLQAKRDRLMSALSSVLEVSTDAAIRESGGCRLHKLLVENLRPRDTIISFNYDCVLDHALRHS